MNRLQKINRELIAQKNNLEFSDFRRSSTINKQQLKQTVYGHNWHWRQKLLQIIKTNRQAYPHFHIQESTRKQQRQKGAEMLFFTKKAIQITYQKYLQDPNILSLTSNAMVMYNAGFSIKNGVHIFLYLKAIFNLGTEKHQKFIQNAAQYKDIGCFGLTQLMHGSNVRGIQTQAHYDHSTRQLVINSPSKEAMKFWIGAAAQVANMSVIWAQLYIDGKCYGVHAFIVPIRDRKTHKLLPGVLIGDCGPKNGCNIIDNGFILLDNVRIPVDNLLNRISGIDQNGKFYTTFQNEDQRFGQHLSALSGGRFMISLNCSSMALAAVTIAIRYCCVRRQFNSPPNHIQNLLIQYPLTKRRMMPLLAQTIVYQIGNLDITQIWDKNYKNILDPKNLIIQDLHGISSTIKPKSAWFATQCIKQCRQMLGGHGYSSFSKLGVLYDDNDINNTWEGDNNVLIQQATKYVLDNLQKVMKGKQIKSQILKFLPNPPQQSDVQFGNQNILDLNFGVKFLQYKIWGKGQDMGMKMLAFKQQKMNNFEIWNNSQVFLGQSIALALGDLFYLTNIIRKIDQIKNNNNKQVLTLIARLWMLRVYRYDDYVNSTHHEMIEKQMSILCKKLTNESLGLLESLSTDDLVLGSPFACPNGNGFEKYMKMVRQSNVENQKPEWWKILKQEAV